jgi:hypothetical protein
MKRFFPPLAVVLLAGLGLAQQLAEEAFVINIEVPVRVFKGSRFIDDLTINDFEITENGKPQKLEAVYYIKKRSVERRDEVQRFVPQTNRNFYLFFEISEYTAKLGQSLDYFVQNVIMPGDSLTVVSPMKTYRLKPRAFEARSRQEISGQIKGLLRRDSTIGSAEYNNIIADLEDLSRAIIAAMAQQFKAQNYVVLDEITVMKYKDLSVDDLLTRYTVTLARLENLRQMDETKLLDFSRILKNDQGQKYVYLFYEREFIPRIDAKTLSLFMDLFQERPDLQQKFNDIFGFYNRESPFNIAQLKESYADASIAIHFLFIARSPKNAEGIQYMEQSDDIYSTFREMSRATGGFSEISQNPVYLMKSAVEASESYYLLYYSPRPYVKDGKFREISVRIKNKDYRVVHRLGYYAD